MGNRRDKEWIFALARAMQKAGNTNSSIAAANAPLLQPDSGRESGNGPPVPVGKSEGRKRERDVAGVLITFAVSLVVGFWFSKALWATASLPPAFYFLSDLAVTFTPWSLNPKFKLQRMAFNVLVCIAATLGAWNFVLHDEYRRQRSAETEGDLIVPRSHNDFPPMIEFGGEGGGFIRYGGPGSSPALIFAYDAGLRVAKENGRVVISTPVRDREGHLIGEITNNHWKVYPPFCSDKNYDKNGIEMKDGAGHVVLQVRLFPEIVRIQGEWHDQFGGGVRIFRFQNGGGAVAWKNAEQEKINETPLIAPMFLYPSSQHWGELAPNPQ